MFDIHVILDDRPGELARFGEALGQAGVGIEGGGVFTLNSLAHAHFLVEDGTAARVAAAAAGLRVAAVVPVLVRRLDQGRSGEPGAIARALADASVNVITQYSDHGNNLILVLDDPAAGAAATSRWDPGLPDHPPSEIAERNQTEWLPGTSR